MLSTSWRRRLAPAVCLFALTGLAVGATTAAGDDGGDPQPVDFAHNVTNAPAPVTSSVFGTGPAVKTGTAICTTATSTAANVNTDCEPTAGPHNETSIAVNPQNHNNIIGGANDYQLGLNPGGHVTETIASRAHVTFDGGRTWSEYPLFSNSAYQATGDPAVAFDADGHAYYATLGFRFVGPANAQNPDVLVSNSGDGGKTWSVSRIAQGSGNEGSVGDLLDKEYVAAWGHGNAIVTFGDFRLAQKGAYVNARIYSSVTHDYGNTWSKPQVISGDLHDAFVSVPTVDGNRIFVSFMNTDDFTTGRDTYYTVEVSPTTGALVGGPFRVGLVYDGFIDYPFAFGSPTYHDSVFRSWAAGNITADPTNPAHLAVVWSDMRNTPHPVPSNPYAAVTNSDVIVSESIDYGRTWSTPAEAVPLANDQWTPWGAFDASGTLRIGTFDRSTDGLNHLYDYTLITKVGPGAYVPLVVSTQHSDPTRDDRWFARTVNPAFPFATAFLGDYSNIAVVPGTTQVVEYWTDMREQACFAGRCGHGEDAYFARTS